MKEYPKINTCFKRDQKTHKIIIGEWATPEFELLAQLEWEGSEKIDGTCVRIQWSNCESLVGEPKVSIKGKTDNSQMPIKLYNELEAVFTKEKMLGIFPEESQVCLYGEGILKPEHYKNKDKFILFDVKIGNLWLERKNIEDIAEKLDIPIAPIVYNGNLWKACEKVCMGFKSTFGNFMAEGLVLRPKVELLSRRGNRIITKIKNKDFNGNNLETVKKNLYFNKTEKKYEEEFSISYSIENGSQL